MEIKKKLKSLDVKLTKLASDLKVSRPTLDTYIEYYENGIQIPNEGYQKIFDYLFNNSEDMTSIEFVKKYDYVKRIMINDASKGAEIDLNHKREEHLYEKVKDEINSDLDVRLLKFINLFIINKDVELVQNIYKYFNYINGYEDLTKNELTQKEKVLYSNMHSLFNKYNKNELDFDENEYKEIIDKNIALFNKKKVNISDEDIVSYIKNNLDDNSNIDIELLRKMIESRETK